MFLFQIGSIKRGLLADTGVQAESFYSKLVRLKARDSLLERYVKETFLFQIGSIKSSLLCIFGLVTVNVSIPNWFD